MKSLFTAILDGLTFKDIAGKRQPRAYTVLTGLLLFLMLVLASCVALERQAMLEEVQGTPHPVQVTLEPTDIAKTEAPVAETCPSDPADWTFVEALTGDAMKRIEETCVYDGLAKSVAWAMTVRAGYTRAEANDLLGFEHNPIAMLGQVNFMTNNRGVVAEPVSFTPLHPDFAEWRLNSAGNFDVAYALRGCTRTYEIVGNKADYWNEDYEVICSLSEQAANTHIVFALNGSVYSTSVEPTQSFALFGYAGNGAWVWLGTRQEPKVKMDDLVQFAQDNRRMAEFFGAPYWDAAWLAQTYGIQMQALPADWQSRTDEGEKAEILNAINQYMSEVQP